MSGSKTNENTFREHPLKIVKYALKNIWLLIFPLIRGIRSVRLNIGALYAWAVGAWFDILIISLILGFGYINWKCTSISLTEDSISKKSGIIIKRIISIPFSTISSASAKHSFYLRPFQAVRLNIDTGAGILSKSDLPILIRRKDLRAINRIMPRSGRSHLGKKNLDIRPKWYTILFFSFVFSSSFSGAVYLSAFILQSGQIARKIIEEEMGDVLKLANNVSAKLALGIPPVAVVLSLLIIATWILSFIANMLRYAGFSMKKDGSELKIKMGVGTVRHVHITPAKINYVDLRQNLLMRPFKTASVNINCPGYGKGSNELPVLLPVLNRRQANRALDLIGFGKYIVRRVWKVSRKAVISYLLLPSLAILLIPLSADIIARIFPSLGGFMLFVKLMGELPAVWMFIVKTIAMLSSGVSIEGDFCCIRYARFYSFHTTLADVDSIVKVQIVQDPIAKRLGRCKLDFYFKSETPKRNRIWGMNKSDADEIMRLLGMKG